MVTAARMKSGFVIVDANGRLPVAPGETIRIKPAAGRLKIARVGKGGKATPVEDVVAIASPKDGGDLVLLLDGHTRVVLDDFMKLCRKGSCDIELPDGKGGVVIIDGTSHAIATGGDGSLLLHITGDQATLSGLTDSFARYYDVLATDHEPTHHAGAPVAKPVIALGALAAAGGFVALAAGGGSHTHVQDPATPEQPVTPDTQTTQTTISLRAVAGPMNAQLGYQIIGPGGVVLASGMTDASGAAHAVIAGRFSGPIMIRVSSVNGDVSDYVDEATGNTVSLGDSLRGLFVVSDGNPTFIVSPITEFAVRASGITDATVPADAAAVGKVNAAVAAAFGIDLSQGVVTVLDSAYDEADGISAAEAYGQALAKLSGLDRVSGGIGQTLDQLLPHYTAAGAEGAFSADGLAMLDRGAVLYESSANRDDATLIVRDVNLGASDRPIGLALLTVTGSAVPLPEGDAKMNRAGLAQLGETIVARVDLPSSAVAGNTLYINVNGVSQAAHVLTFDNIVSGQVQIAIPVSSMSSEQNETVTIQARVGNAGPNGSTVSTSFAVDFMPPPTPTLAFNQDTGASSVDGITANGIVDVGGIADGAAWEYSTNAGATWTTGGDIHRFNLVAGTYPAGMVIARQKDAAGNSSAGATLAAQVLTSSPTVEIAIDRQALKAGDTATVTFTFSTEPVDFDIAGIEATYGLISNLVQSQSDRTVYTATFSASASAGSGNAVITVATGAYHDMAGNSGMPAQSQEIAVDTLAPTVLDISFLGKSNSSNSASSVGDYVEFGVSFSENVQLASSGTPPALAIMVGNTIRHAVFQRVDGGDTLVFRYTIQAGDTNGDGYDDLIIGSPGAGGQAGAYILFGSSGGAFAPATMVEYDGTSDSDAFNSDGVGTTMMGRGGNDQIYMTGPDSVGYGGAGDDTFIVHPSFLGSLANPDPGAPRSSRIDGGSGIDTMKIAEYYNGTTIDLRDLTAGSAAVTGDSPIENIEIVDLLAGGSASMLWVSEDSVIAMSRANVFMDDGRAQLLVKGDEGDTLDVQFLEGRPGYMLGGTINYNFQTYSIVRTDLVDVFVQQGITIAVL
ncbi:FG-GAP repeat-containing protein [Aureimonas altamirensis DSM 21988]|uniref:FG-GAP repeat-containing protein n=1 Tax=Aureimonas altamirensis DSM 21988 TaxID=1121026 RepID=A0ABY1IIF4_9HYPH|nr:Ig-like domain-containing protein [Aureimonas altamirensis]SHJ21194.1 FG-GAP repeat-containing protein [Aureimonas altamirensis DSM 21988]